MAKKLKIGARRPLWLLACAAIIAGCATDEPAPVEDRSLAESMPPVAMKAGEGSYRVVRGDTLYAIAFKRGLDYRDVAAWNGIAPPYRILVGQELRLTAPAGSPRSVSAPSVASTSPASAPNTSAIAAKPPVASSTTSAQAATGKNVTVFEDVPSQFAPPSHAATESSSATATQGKPVVASSAPPTSSAPSTTTDDDEAAAVRKSITAAAAAPAVAAAAPSAPGTASSNTSSTGPAAPIAAAPIAAAPKPAPPSEPVPPPARPTNDAPAANAGGIGWHWPSAGKLLGGFVGGDQTKQGIDIGGNEGDPVKAAADGDVVYSGNGLIGYGELIIIKHNASFLSAYGHNRRRLVQEGDKVRAGQQIAEMGSSASSRDELHFEIRKNGKPVNPMDYLPAR